MVRDPMQGEAPIRLPSRDEAPTQAETPAALAHSPIPVLGGATKKDPRNPRATRGPRIRGAFFVAPPRTGMGLWARAAGVSAGVGASSRGGRRIGASPCIGSRTIRA